MGAGGQPVPPHGGDPSLALAGTVPWVQIGSEPEDGGPPVRSGPWWEPYYRRLWLDGECIKVFRSWAPDQTALLAAFQWHRWAAYIVDPLALRPGEDRRALQRRLWETRRNLNAALPPDTIRFVGDGTGRGVRWQRCRRPAAGVGAALPESESAG